MISWLLGAVAGVLVALWQYGRQAVTPRLALPALLRALSVALVVALLLDAPVGRPAFASRDVAVDASESWLRAAPRCDRWRAALDTAAALGGGHWTRFGDSVRADVDATTPPRDRASQLRPVVDRAAAAGRPVVIITDGELDDADALTALPRGSRLIVAPCPPLPDAALATLEAPRALLAGDSARASVVVVAGAAGAPAGAVELRLDSAVIARSPHDALAPWAEQTVELRGPVSGGERSGVLRAVLAGSADAEPRNDTLGVGVDVSRAPAAVFVSTAPDYDAREAVGALRGVSSLPTRAYYRVAPGAWRTDTFSPAISITESSDSSRTSSGRGAPTAPSTVPTSPRFGRRFTMRRSSCCTAIPRCSALRARPLAARCSCSRLPRPTMANGSSRPLPRRLSLPPSGRCHSTACPH